MTLRIVVIGSSGKIPPALEAIAQDIGAEIAKRGAILITGGRDGIMEAASKGAKKNNGITVGILPGSTIDGANQYLDVILPTGIGYARNFINIVSGDAIISLAGAGGTLSEIGFSIALRKMIILMEGTGGVTDMLTQNISLFKEANIQICTTAKEAIGTIFNSF